MLDQSEKRIVELAISRLSELYGRQVSIPNGLADGPSVSCRDEALLRGGRARHSRVGTVQDGETNREVGIIHFRAITEQSPCWPYPCGLGMAEAFLQPPDYWRHPDRIPLLSAQYPRLLGHDNAGISCVPFSAQFEASGTCTMACMDMALLALCLPDRGATPLEGPFSLSCMFQIAAYSGGVPVEAQEAILADSEFEMGSASPSQRTVIETHARHADGWRTAPEAHSETRLFGIGGVPFEAMPFVFAHVKGSARDGSGRARGVNAELYIAPSEEISLRDFACVLYSYISSRLPVIVRVDDPLLLHPKVYPWRPLPQESLHAVMVVGCNNLIDENEQRSVCLHDPKTGPYMELSLVDFFEAAKTRLGLPTTGKGADEDDDRVENEYADENMVKMVVPVPHNLVFDVEAALEVYESLKNSYTESNMSQYDFPERGWWRIRALRSEQALRAYYDAGRAPWPLDSTRKAAHSRFAGLMRAMLNPLDALLCLEMFDTQEAASRLIPDRVIFIDAPTRDEIRAVGALFSRCVEDDVELVIAELAGEFERASSGPARTAMVSVPRGEFVAVPMSRPVGGGLE